MITQHQAFAAAGRRRMPPGSVTFVILARGTLAAEDFTAVRQFISGGDAPGKARGFRVESCAIRQCRKRNVSALPLTQLKDALYRGGDRCRGWQGA
jgi:hypothetical protein